MRGFSIELSERRPTGRHFHRYLNPDRAIDEGAKAVTGIADEFLLDKPRFHETVDELLGRMTDRRIRHLPVLKDGRLAGIVSIGDLVKFKISEVEAEADGLKAYIAAG